MEGCDMRNAAKRLVAPGKGILAIDDNADVVFPRFAELGIEQTGDMLKNYWSMVTSIEGLSEFVSGVILSEDAIAMDMQHGKSFLQGLAAEGIAAGVGLDQADIALPSSEAEKVAGGLDTLEKRLTAHAAYGVHFAKWCMPVRITEALPTDFGYQVNAIQLARYAAIAQSLGIVPIVEFDIVTEGDHPIERCTEVTGRMLEAIFPALHAQRVDLAAIVLKPNMVTAGRGNAHFRNIEAISRQTVSVLRRFVPADVPGIAFLSGGQSPTESTANLNAINMAGRDAPWPMTFCFGRALQDPAQSAWQGQASRRKDAQRALMHRAKMNSLAQRAIYDPALENQD